MQFSKFLIVNQTEWGEVLETYIIRDQGFRYETWTENHLQKDETRLARNTWLAQKNRVSYDEPLMKFLLQRHTTWPLGCGLLHI